MNPPSVLIRESLLLFAQEGGGDGAGGQQELSFFEAMLTSPFLLIGGLLALFYVMVLLPEKRKKREAAERLNQLKKNDRVVTIGGIHGTIVSTGDSDVVTIRTDESGTNRLRINRSAIATVVNESDGGGSSEKKEKTVK